MLIGCVLGKVGLWSILLDVDWVHFEESGVSVDVDWVHLEGSGVLLTSHGHSHGHSQG